MDSHGQAERPSREAEQEVRPSRVCGILCRAQHSVKNVPVDIGDVYEPDTTPSL